MIDLIYISVINVFLVKNKDIFYREWISFNELGIKDYTNRMCIIGVDIV